MPVPNSRKYASYQRNRFTGEIDFGWGAIEVKLMPLCRTRLAHSVVVTRANIHEKHALPQLLPGHERVYGDSTYASQQELNASKTCTP